MGKKLSLPKIIRFAWPGSRNWLTQFVSVFITVVILAGLMSLLPADLSGYSFLFRFLVKIAGMIVFIGSVWCVIMLILFSISFLLPAVSNKNN